MDNRLEEALSEPTPELVEDLRGLDGDILVLGAGGKMGPSLARMASRASRQAGSTRRVIAASRFSSEETQRCLQSWGVETLVVDLLSRADLSRLPRAPNVVFMAGRKFGSTGRESLTWAMNVLVPSAVCETLRGSRFVAFSTGNVYGLSPVERGGSVETDPLRPDGEYAMSCVGRERVFEHHAELGVPSAILRLNYACDLRYGVLVDLAGKVLRGEPIDLAMGWFNTIWQGDASAMALRMLARTSAPPLVLNVTGTELLRVRDVAAELGRLLGRTPAFRGEEGRDAILSNAGEASRLLGAPRVAAGELIRMVAEWALAGGRSLQKPTHFEVRDGRF
jgi:nucleoside-diphosphate-sugar epimerase